ncbi:Hypothetical predicted protein [Olea europaea subsp. europaea]|uniref:Uncharacterized protein n=1 Tax=Olea europaea subsp. europaea TaxID=158383 RepID=A0A8S0V744_OLEEU|nr:Hypothetical predicted protein [Olea europaea subsp. europaea]
MEQMMGEMKATQESMVLMLAQLFGSKAHCKEKQIKVYRSPSQTSRGILGRYEIHSSQVSEVSESGVLAILLGGSNAQNCEIPTESRSSEKLQLENDSSKSLHMDAKLNSAYINYQTDVITDVDECSGRMVEKMRFELVNKASNGALERCISSMRGSDVGTIENDINAESIPGHGVKEKPFEPPYDNVIKNLELLIESKNLSVEEIFVKTLPVTIWRFQNWYV